MIDWKKKLTSRKFWAALIGFITPTLLAFNVSEEQVTQVAAIIMAGATLIAYIFAEGWTDASASDTQVQIVSLPELEAEDFETEEIEDDDEDPDLTDEPEVDLSFESGITPEKMLEG